jgi:putative ABC transport system permease protein
MVLMSVQSLMLHKLRAGLAALGILIGTTTVIWLVAMGEGVGYEIQQQIKDLGATNIIVRSVKTNDSGTVTDDNSRVKTYGLLRADYDRFLSNVPTVRQAVPMRELRREIRVKGRRADIRLVGCTEAYRELLQLEIARGRWLNPYDEAESVIVLADETARRLFPYENPIGQTVWVPHGISGSHVYTVVGQTKPRAASAAIGGSLEAREYNSDAYIPLTTLRRRVGDFEMQRTPGGLEGEIVELSQITLTVKDVAEVDATAALVEMLLQRFHKKEDYAVVVPKELLRQAEETRAMFNLLLVVIAGISLVVGGIGIMNIMLATVTERTREIGIRRALGAKHRDIIQQFLAETMVLSGVGGVVGVLVGLMCGPLFRAARTLVALLSPGALPPVVESLEPRIAPWSVVLSLVISLGVGLVFGVYPARRAALLDPIEALRHN